MQTSDATKLLPRVDLLARIASTFLITFVHSVGGAVKVWIFGCARGASPNVKLLERLNQSRGSTFGGGQKWDPDSDTLLMVKDDWLREERAVAFVADFGE